MIEACASWCSAKLLERAKNIGVGKIGEEKIGAEKTGVEKIREDRAW